MIRAPSSSHWIALLPVLTTARSVAEVQTTPNNDQFVKVTAGECKFTKPGIYRLWLEPVVMEKGEQLMNVREVVLKPK